MKGNGRLRQVVAVDPKIWPERRFLIMREAPSLRRGPILSPLLHCLLALGLGSAGCAGEVGPALPPDGTRTRRKPRTPVLSKKRLRPPMWFAARQYWPATFQLPPRTSWSEHHCHTLPCMSYKPSLFGGYEPTLVVRVGKGPLSAGWSPAKFACFNHISFVGFSK